MVIRYILKKEIKKIGNSQGLTFSKEEKKAWKIKVGDIIIIEILKIEETNAH